MSIIGYSKQEENIIYLSFIIPQLLQNHDKLSIKSWQVSEKGTKREEIACPTLKNERYFDGFSIQLYTTANSHDVKSIGS